jgi:hypothetical protein
MNRKLLVSNSEMQFNIVKFFIDKISASMLKVWAPLGPAPWGARGFIKSL